VGGLLPVELEAQAVRSNRLRRLSPLPIFVLIRPLLLASAPIVFAFASAAPALALPPCSEPGSGWCLARRFSGDVPRGEVGFRFGSPLDADGDGKADVAAGSRFKLAHNVYQNGVATVWSGASGAKIREWDGTLERGLFGHWVMPIADIDGDALADVVVAAPQAMADDEMHGVVEAHSPKSGKALWRMTAERQEMLGWDMDLAGDQNGDGKTDLFVGSPCEKGGRVYLVSGKNGSLLRSYEPPTIHPSFGWYVASVDDVDADGKRDLLVGNVQGGQAPDVPPSEVFLISSSRAAVLRTWSEADKTRAFGEVLAGLGDLDGDGHGDLAIASPRTSDPQQNSQPGDVQIYSSKSGKELQRWTGRQAGELYGRMVTSAGDIDGDGIDDVAIGSPRYKVGDRTFVGRAEVRSGKTGDVLAEWFGEDADDWFGWHIRRAPDPDGQGRPALLIGSLMRSVGSQARVGVIDLYVLRKGQQ